MPKRHRPLAPRRPIASRARHPARPISIIRRAGRECPHKVRAGITRIIVRRPVQVVVQAIKARTMDRRFRRHLPMVLVSEILTGRRSGKTACRHLLRHLIVSAAQGMAMKARHRLHRHSNDRVSRPQILAMLICENMVNYCDKYEKA
jgi:hypothetical protein